MGKNSRKEYLFSIRKRYKSLGKSEKKKILDEFCINCGYNRKYAIRILNQQIECSRKKKLGTPKKYDNPGIKEFLITTWKASNLACSRRLKSIITLWLPMYSERLTIEEVKLLKEISASTIDRIFKPIRNRYKKRGLSTTKPGSIIKELIPIRTNQWDESRVGYLEADTVAHCGNSTSGMFAYTVNMVDVASGWSIQRAVWGKGEAGVLDAIQNIETILPFKMRGFDCDNGSEFLNWHLLKYFKHRALPVEYTRSRAYHKNDNAHIEGKNWTLKGNI